MFFIGLVVAFLGMLIMVANDEMRSTNVALASYIIIVVGAAVMASAL